MKLQLISILLAGTLLAGCGSASAGSGNAASSANSSPSSESALSAASSGSSSSVAASSGSSVSASSSDSRILVMYFDQGMNSVSSGNDEADAVTSASLAGYSSDDLTENNIRVMKNEIISKTGGVPYSIRVNEPYADDYEDMVNQAQDDQDDDKQFSFQTPLPNLSGYDVVFVGMPVWWGGLPQPVVNVFEQLDFSGKTIIPFGIHLGSGFGQMISQIKEFEPNAEVSDDGLTINSRTANEEVRSETDEWIDGLTY